MSTKMQLEPVTSYHSGIGRGSVVARAHFTFAEQRWEYLVLTCPEYTYQLALVELATGETHGPYEYVLPEYTLADLLSAAEHLAAEVLERK